MQKNRLNARLSRTGFLFCLPQIIGFTFVFLCPLILCVYYSMTNKSGNFSGFANYRDLWDSGTFRLSLGNTFRFSAIGVLLLVGISFFLAVGFHHLLLYSSRKIKWMQSGLITPMVIPSAVIILFVRFLDSGGMLNQWMDSKTLYLQQSPYAFWILIVLYLWKNCGYCTVILLSALAGIDRAQYEAARCDGASVWTQIWHITFPQILSSLFFSSIIAIVGVFKVFRESYLLMGEYPHESVYMLQNFINNNMETLNYQRLSAASLTFLCILMVVIILFIRFSGILEEGGETNGKKKRRRPGETLLYGFLALFSLLVLAPFLFTVIHSLMPPEQVQSAYGNLGSGTIQLQLWPKPLGIRQYIRVFFGTELEWYYSFHNTILLSVPILLITILLCTMSGYGLSKFRFPGRKALLTSYIIILLLPVQVTLVPFFIFFNGMHLMDSLFPLIGFCAFSPFGAFLIYQFIRSIPDSSIEAARLEGASEWRIFWRIVFPQAKPGIAALTILTLIDSFSMIEQPFMLLRKKSWYPMSIMLKYLSQQHLSEAFVLAIVFVIPIFLSYLLLQDYLIEGISYTSPGRVK